MVEEAPRGDPWVYPWVPQDPLFAGRLAACHARDHFSGLASGEIGENLLNDQQYWTRQAEIMQACIDAIVKASTEERLRLSEYAVNEDALAVREARKAQFKRDEQKASRIYPEERAGELRLVAKKCAAMSRRVDKLGQSDLAEDLLTVSKFAWKMADKASLGSK